MNQTYQTILNLAARAKKIILTSHVNPDGDAVGSVLALYHTFSTIDIDVKVILPSEIPHNLTWMPGAETVEVFKDYHAKLFSESDLVFVVDLNDVGRLKELGDAIVGSGVGIVNIDHHTFPKDFARAQWIDTDAAATCVMLDTFVWDFVQTNRLQLTPLQEKNIAMCLYVGIMTDTGSFRFPRTTSETHRIVARLIDKGADPVLAYENIMNTSSPARTKLLGSALSSMEFYSDHKLCLMTVTKGEFMESGCVVADLDGFVHHATASTGVQIGVLIVELADEIKCSLRSKGAFHVRDIASKYGGGGHSHAAGVRITDKSLEDVKALLIADCTNELQRARL
jgi:bifunctional oligoribonuclease and PAP phosphatase NrnA